MSPVRSELRRLVQLALPVVASTVGTSFMGVVDTAMVGRVGAEALAGAAIGNVAIWGTFLLFQGFLQGMDPLVAQAHGAGRGEECGRILQRAIVLALVLSIPLSLLWAYAGAFFRLTGQDPALVAEAERYVAVQIPSVPFMLVFVALRQYLHGRELMRPPMWVVGVANVSNVFLNWVLIFGHLGFPAMGLVGAGIATTLNRVLMCLALVLLVQRWRLHEGAWVPWSRDALDLGRLWRIAAIGAPVAIQVAAEVWAFSGSTLISGRLGTVAIGAHTVTLNLAALAFMFPLGVSQGAATRVGNLIGAGRPEDAQRAAWLSIGMGAALMAAFAGAFIALRPWLPRIYTADPEVIAASMAILPIAAAFAVFDGTQVVGCGVLRGMGDTRPAARYNVLGYWVLGLPLGGWFALRGGAGIAGVWWGLALGLAVVSGLLLLRIARRGPAILPAGADLD